MNDITIDSVKSYMESMGWIVMDFGDVCVLRKGTELSRAIVIDKYSSIAGVLKLVWEDTKREMPTCDNPFVLVDQIYECQRK